MEIFWGGGVYPGILGLDHPHVGAPGLVWVCRVCPNPATSQKFSEVSLSFQELFRFLFTVITFHLFHSLVFLRCTIHTERGGILSFFPHKMVSIHMKFFFFFLIDIHRPFVYVLCPVQDVGDHDSPQPLPIP